MTLVRREPPYEGSVVPPERSKAQIEKLLLDHGAEGVRITTLRGGAVQVEFVIEVESKGVRSRFACRIDSPTIERHVKRMVKDQYGYATKKLVTERDMTAELRLMHWYIKSLVEAASYGLLSAERIFMSHILFALPEGGQATAGEIIERAVAEGRAPTVLGFSGESRPALKPAKPEAIDAEYRTEGSP